MNSVESVAVIACILILGAKLYTVWRGKKETTSTSEPYKLKNPEPVTVDSADMDPDISAGDKASTEIWNETYLIAISLLVCGPFGLILLWRTDKWDSDTKARMTMGYLGVVLLLMIFGFISAYSAS